MNDSAGALHVTQIMAFITFPRTKNTCSRVEEPLLSTELEVASRFLVLKCFPSNAHLRFFPSRNGEMEFSLERDFILAGERIAQISSHVGLSFVCFLDGHKSGGSSCFSAIFQKQRGSKLTI